ncbi:hypothetical protein MHU86_23580 [Fragilaria crotonensis]|nr:hypothetical protein MHU86_23580 [Fragilaria crotonensis]
MGNIPIPHGDLDMSSESDAKQSAFTLSNEVMTNDGTHRISFKWKHSQKEFNEIVDDKQRLSSELHSMLGIVFLDADGFFYMWDGEDLVNPKRVNELTISDLKDYREPQITKVHTMHLIVFAVRFAFTENPISWRNSDHAQEAMKLNNLRIQESNINTIAGIPIVAGYILLKHPTMTLRHKYTQFLRSQAADTLPYFDIRLHRKTPTDKSIAHLVVYCGETQVTELCQGLSKILNGQQTAVFLPRYTFANMSKDQIDNHFGMHDTYVRALRPISLAPLVTTLDLKRIEYFSDGTTIERSTRDWVSSLMRTDGTTHAQCDVVNGTKNVRIAYVMAPAAYAPEIREMVTQYKERLRPISHREAKYREGIPDLPDVIHITSTVQTNLDYMAKLSSSDIWSKAPSSVKSPSSAAGSPNVARRPTQSGGSTHSEDRTQWPSLVKRPGGTNASSSITSERQSGGKSQFKEKSTSQAAPREKISQTSLNSAENDERAETVSTHSLTNTLRTSATTRMTELENQMRECRELLRSNREAARDSSERLVATEQGLRETMETITEMTHTVAALQTQFAGFNITMESMRLMLHTLMHQQSNNTTPQYAALPYTAFHPPPATIPLVTIPESSHTATMSMESEEENQSTTSEGSKYRQSPGKKKQDKEI